MRSRTTLLMVGLTMAACTSVQPIRVAAGDVCTRCLKVISEPRTGAELIDTEGRAFKFRTAGCMAKYLKAHPAEQAGSLFVSDYATGRLVSVSAAKFVPTMMGEGYERKLDYVGYYTAEGAADAARRANSTPVDWQRVLADATPE